VQPHRHKTIASAFSGRLLRTLCAGMVLILTTFAWQQHRQRSSETERAVIEQAQLVSAAVASASNGDWAGTVEQMRSHYDRLLAVARLDAGGSIESMFPDRPGHRRAFELAMSGRDPIARAGSGPATMLDVDVTQPETGEHASAHCVIVSLIGSGEGSLARIAVLLAAEPSAGEWIESMFLFAAPVTATGLFGFLSLTGWFNRRVAGPLRNLGHVIGDPRGAIERGQPLQPGGWRETTQIAIHFEELLKDLVHTDAQRRRAEATAKREIAKQEQGFQRQLRRTEDRVYTDPLTKLRNRAYLEEHLEHIFKQQCGEGMELSAVAIDIDNFKQHNDSLGHQAGDALLKFVGALLKGSIRPTDHAIRYGGDEFILLLPGAGTQPAAMIANRIVKLFGQYARRLGPSSNVSLSAGVASLNDDKCANGHELVARADAALYAAKRIGKNTVAAGHAS